MSIRRVASGLKARLSAFAGGIRSRTSTQRFLRSESGAVAIYFGLSAIVFVGVAGLAVDAARGYLLKARLSEAIDAAALAGGKALPTGNNLKVEADAKAFFKANFPNGALGATVNDPQVVINNDQTVVNVTSTAQIPTTLMRVLGFNNMQTVGFASVTRATNGLDVVFSFDVSGSMGDSAGGTVKIDSLKKNAKLLVNTLAKPFTSGLQQQKVTINGIQYSLLNIGVVPWNSKVNVRTHGHENDTDTVNSFTVSSYTDPTLRSGGMKTTVFKASSAPSVPLLRNPKNISGGWRGCVYARYMDDGNGGNDADTVRGAVTVGNKTWPGWEPVPRSEGDTSNCDARYWNSDPNQWPYDNTSSFSGTARPSNAAWPNPATPTHSFFEGCDTCPSIGILPLQTDVNTVNNMIDDLDAGGATDAPQGLFWAWEVLMPGEPFDEAKVSTPFPRVQAIVFMTDGQNWGSNGDAYHGWYGDSPTAGTREDKLGNLTMPAWYSGNKSLPNNLNNKLRQLASNIKGADPLDASAVKIYVIQYDNIDAELTKLLKEVSTKESDYYFYASSDATLETAFKKIASSLSALKLAQ